MNEEELTLWNEYMTSRSDADRDRLFLLYYNMQFVEKIAMRLKRRIPSSPLLQYEDLVDFGHEALLWSVERFDPARGVKFTSFAGTRVQGAMLDGMRSVDWAPRNARESEEVISEMVSLESLSDSEGKTPEFLATCSEHSDAEAEDDRRKFLRSLSSFERKVLDLVFLQEWTIQEVAMRLRCVPGRVSKAKKRIIARLKSAASSGTLQERQPSPV